MPGLAAVLVVSLAQPAAAGAVTHGPVDVVHGWRIRSAALAGRDGAAISRPGYDVRRWLPISRPETLMAALVENGRFARVTASTRLARVPRAPFASDWWYRAELSLAPRPGEHVFLAVNGVLGSADLWVNGRRLLRRRVLQGAYARFEVDVTRLARRGRNAVALDVSPNDDVAGRHLTLTTVDWSQPAPDRASGLQLAPQVEVDGPVSLRNVHVVETVARDLRAADLEVRGTVRNDDPVARRAEVDVTVTGNGAIEHAVRSILVPAHAVRPVVLGARASPQLHLVRPAIWWPYGMGAQPLYHVAVEARVDGAVSDAAAEDIGIRTVSSRLTPVRRGTYGRHGYRQYLVNGQPLLVRGAGYGQDLFLRYDPARVAAQLDGVRSMGLNALRFEGNLPPDDLFARLDRAGILALPGWQCCDTWERPWSALSLALRASAARSARRVAARLRDHPSVLAFWLGSDLAPDAAKERVFVRAFRAADFRAPLVAAAEYRASPRLGPSGQKEGPYDETPPIGWWYAGRAMNLGGDFTNAGGAFGFDTEASSGNTIPTLDSLARFLTPRERAQIADRRSTRGPGSGPTLYHVGAYNDYTTIARLGAVNTALWRRYGPWRGLVAYEREAQVAQYEATRAMFEAYVGHAGNRANPSTGLVYWRLDAGWPSLGWQLLGDDGDQPGAFFGAQAANRPLHALYAYDARTAVVANLTGAAQRGLVLDARISSLTGRVTAAGSAPVPALASGALCTVLRPRVPARIRGAYFLELRLRRGPVVVSRDVYWLSTRGDRLDFAATVGRGAGAIFRPGGYADLRGLRGLARAAVAASATTVRDGADDVTTVRLRNVAARGTPAFFLRADVRRGRAGGARAGGDDQVLPVTWTLDDVTLLAGEEAVLVARYSHARLAGAPPVVTVTGVNLRARTVPAPLTAPAAAAILRPWPSGSATDDGADGAGAGRRGR